jgi:hypothetical protein
MLETGKNGSTRWVLRAPRWARFGLRTFLVGVAIVSIVFGMISRELVRLRHQRAVVAQLVSEGGAVEYDYQFDSRTMSSAPSLVLKPLRWAFGDDLFAEVAGVSWDYTYRSIPADQIKLLSELPTIRRVAFYGSPRADGRPPAPGEAPPRDWDAQAEINAQAEAFGTIAKCKNLLHLALYGGLPTDDHIKQIRSAASLRQLELSYSPHVTDAAIETISGFKNLTSLDIRELPNVTDAGLATLSRITNLKSLDVSRTPVGDLALEQLGQLVGLERLLLDMSPVSDAGLSALGQLKQLRLLGISRCNITDEGLKTVGAMTELRELDLSGTQITDAGLVQLLTLKALTKLNLASTQVTDEGLVRLTKLANLQRLVVLLGDKVTLDGIRRAKRDLPDCLFECLFTPAQGQPPALYAWE